MRGLSLCRHGALRTGPDRPLPAQLREDNRGGDGCRGSSVRTAREHIAVGVLTLVVAPTTTPRVTVVVSSVLIVVVVVVGLVGVGVRVVRAGVLEGLLLINPHPVGHVVNASRVVWA